MDVETDDIICAYIYEEFNSLNIFTSINKISRSTIQNCFILYVENERNFDYLNMENIINSRTSFIFRNCISFQWNTGYNTDIIYITME